MSFWKQISPRRAVKDFHNEWKRPTSHRWTALGVSFAATFAILAVFLPADQRIDPRSPEVFWISTFAPDRTREEIIASNCANQRLKDELQAKLDERTELRKSLYRELGRATFVDVDEMEAEIEAERALEEDDEPELTEAELALSIEEYCARASA